VFQPSTFTREPERLRGVILGVVAHDFAQSMCESKGCAGSTAGTVIPGAALTALFGAMIGTGFSRLEPAVPSDVQPY
jgi:hypothetical protein